MLAACCLGLVLGCGQAEPNEPVAPHVNKPDSHTGNRALYDPNAPIPELSPEEAQRAVQDVRRLWHQRKAVFRSHFLGIPTQQNPTDAWIVQEIISEVKPELMIETGTFKGGSAIMWATILEQLDPNSRVITIDIADQRTPRAKQLAIAKRRVDFLLGSSADPKIVEEVRRRAEGKRVLVLLDSLHTPEHIAKELAAYAPLVPVGGYVIVQDTAVGGVPAVEAFVAENPNWEIDIGRQRFALTNTMKGYLKRVR